MKSNHPLDTSRSSLMVDASAFIALFDPADQYHHQAVTFRDAFILQYNIQLFTTNYIYSETMSHLSHLSSEKLRNLDSLIRKPSAHDPLKFKQIWVKKATIEKAISIFFKYLEHGFSIVDCTCLVLMEEYGIPSAFTFDDHFKIYTYQKGYENSQRGFWKLPEMLLEYIAHQSNRITIR